MSDGEHIRGEELELYALGALHEEEAAALKTHVAECGECAMKLAQAHGGAALLGFAAKQERPAGTIKAELMAHIHVNREKEEAYAWPLLTSDRRLPQTATMAVNAKKTPWWTWVLVPVGMALALVSLGLSWQNRRLSAKLAAERQGAVTLVEDRKQIEKLMKVLAAADTATVKLERTGDASSGEGVVKYNKRMGIVVYSAHLPPLPAGKIYKMWLSPESGVPFSAGVLGPEGQAWGNLWTAAVPVGTEAKEFAVTIEALSATNRPTGPKVLQGAN